MHEWPPEGHLAYYVSVLVDEPDLTAFHAPYGGDGRRNAPYELRMMVKVLPYRYATEVFPSRGISGRPEENVTLSGVGYGGSSEPLHALPVSPSAFVGLQGSVCGGGASGAQDGIGALQKAVGGRAEGAGEHEQTQGDRLRSSNSLMGFVLSVGGLLGFAGAVLRYPGSVGRGRSRSIRGRPHKRRVCAYARTNACMRRGFGVRVAGPLRPGRRRYERRRW